MAREIYRFNVTVPAGTLVAAPAKFDLRMPERVVTRVEVRIPPGPRGEVGFQLGTGGLQIIPINAGQFVVTDDEKLGWEVETGLTSGAWQCIAYNTGTFNHGLEFVFLTEIVASSPHLAGFVPIPAASLAG